MIREHTGIVTEKSSEWLPEATGIFSSCLNGSKLGCGNHLHGLGDFLDILHTLHSVPHCANFIKTLQINTRSSPTQ